MDEECYLVPALLTSLSDYEQLSSDDPCPLLFFFAEGFPPGLFHVFAHKVIASCPKLFGEAEDCKPLIQKLFVRFFLGKADYAITIAFGKRIIKVRRY